MSATSRPRWPSIRGPDERYGAAGWTPFPGASGDLVVSCPHARNGKEALSERAYWAVGVRTAGYLVPILRCPRAPCLKSPRDRPNRTRGHFGKHTEGEDTGGRRSEA